MDVKVWSPAPGTEMIPVEDALVGALLYVQNSDYLAAVWRVCRWKRELWGWEAKCGHTRLRGYWFSTDKFCPGCGGKVEVSDD